VNTTTVFKPDCTLFKELHKKRKQLPSQYSCNKNTKENIKTLLWRWREAVNYLQIFDFHGGSWNLTPMKSKG
jgi:hypothetical protein